MRQVIIIVVPLIQTAILLSSCTVYGMAQTMNKSCENASAIGKQPATLALDLSPSTSLSSGLFLNTRYQAPCDGIVVAWKFCYHVYMPPQQDHNDLTKIQAGVWRQNNYSEYQIMTESLIDLPIIDLENNLQFACYRLNLTCGTFEVKKGDIVGVFMNGTKVVNVLSESGQDNGIVRANNTITSIKSPVSNSGLDNTLYSLYLVAVVMANFTENCTTSPDPSTPLCNSGKSWEYYVIGLLAASVVLLIIMTAATIGRLCFLRQRSKGSAPVLIKKMKTGNQKVTRILMVSEEAGQHIGCTEIEQEEDGDSSQHPTASSRQPPPLLSNPDGSQLSPEQDEFTSPMSPPPVVFAASFDIDQQSDDDQERFIFKPSHLKHTCTKPQKIVNSDLKRSHSAADAMNVAYSTSTDASSCPYTASTEYPYVLHAFEVVGKNQTRIGSLPNIIEHRFLEDEATDPHSNLDNNQGRTAYFQMDTAVDSNSDDDEPTYSYADRRNMTAKDLPTRRSKLPSIVEQATNQDYHYGEYPSAWNPTSLLLVQPVTQSSSEYMRGDHNQSTEFSALPSNQVPSTQDQKQSSDMQDNALPLKPTLKPRKNPAYKVTPNSAALHSPAGMNTTEKNCRPSEMISSNQMTENPSSIDEVGAGAMSVAKTPPIYMKLLETTKDEFHRYTYLFDGTTETNELTISDLYPERAHPNEWSKQTKC